MTKQWMSILALVLGGLLAGCGGGTESSDSCSPSQCHGEEFPFYAPSEVYNSDPTAPDTGQGEVDVENGSSDSSAQEDSGSVVECGAAREGVGVPGEWAATLSSEPVVSKDIPTLLTDEDLTLHTSDKQGAVTTHRVYIPGDAAGRLFIFFAGTGSIPQQYSLLLSVAAELRYHVIGLVYANQQSVNGTCKSSDDECACLGNIRMEILTGSDTSADVNVGLADSVDNRLVKLMEYLIETDPADGWDAFLDDSGAVRWDKVTLGGHSQGGGHVAMMAQRYELARAVFFSSPADNCTSNGVKGLPDWADWPLKTPADRLYGLSHLKEKGRDNHQMNWDNLGMPSGGCLVDVDSSYPPYANSQMLVTGVEPASGPCPASGICDAAHGATVADTPMDAENKPVLLPAWHYLMAIE